MMQESSNKKISRYSFAFYNLENLFDSKDDPKTMDDDFTENSKRNWSEKRFQKKTKKLGKVISQIGYKDIGYPPVLIGVAEVENMYVMEELTKSKFLKNKGYDILHFDSPDERGIDTGLLYRSDYFKVIDHKAVGVYLTNEFNERDFTRDILYVKGTLENEALHILVNHWPSRRAGVEETNARRMAVAKKNQEIIKEIVGGDANAKIIIMGDFNDGPQSESVKLLGGNDFYNPMELLLTKYEGSLNFKGDWFLFDQILVSNNFLQQHGNSFRFDEAKIFNPTELREYKGRNKGNPFRTFRGRKYIGGISDHFPVYAIFSSKPD